MWRFIRWCSVIGLLLGVVPLAQGTYPDRPVRFVIAFPPGGATDTGTPEPTRAKLEKTLEATMKNPAVRERLAKVDTDPSFAPGPALRVKLEREITNWSKFIDAKGIKVEQ
jgi:tripartite-type tricarboxylate transporter receptor subunit TctC